MKFDRDANFGWKEHQGDGSPLAFHRHAVRFGGKAMRDLGMLTQNFSLRSLGMLAVDNQSEAAHENDKDQRNRVTVK